MNRALCLSGGGARGVVQLGMLQGYFESNDVTHAIFGTSVGALNGTLVAQKDFPKLKTIWQNIKNNHIYTWAPWNVFNSSASLFSTKPLGQLIRSSLDINKIKASSIPINISATCVNPIGPVSKDLRNLSAEEAAEWILASSSAPVGFPVQTVGGLQYTDGGPSTNFNIMQAISSGYDEIVLLACSPISGRKINNLIDMIEFNFAIQAFDQMHDETSTIRLLDKTKTTVALTVYQPETVDLKMLDFNSASKNYEKYFKIGYDLIKKPAAQFRKVLKSGKPTWTVYK